MMDQIFRMLGGDDELIGKLADHVRADAGERLRFMAVLENRDGACDSAACTKRDGALVFTLEGDPAIYSSKGINIVPIDEHNTAYLHIIFDPATAIELIEALQNAVNEVQARQASAAITHD